MLKDILQYILQNVVDNPQQVIVREISSGSIVILEISVPQADRGYIIGKQGRHIDALRILMNGIGSKIPCKVMITMKEDE